MISVSEARRKIKEKMPLMAADFLASLQIVQKKIRNYVNYT